jgi:hypothetical protein
MPVVLSNNAATRLASSLTATATSLAVTAGTGARFPQVGVGDFFPVTLIKADGSMEITRCVSRNGDVLNIQRGQEGTAAQSFSANDRVELRITNSVMAEFAQLSRSNGWPVRQLMQQGIDVQAFTNPSWQTNMDVLGSTLRIFSSQNGANFRNALELDFFTQQARVFGATLWNTANFNPANYLPANGKAVDANLLDGLDSTQYMRPGTAMGTALTYFRSGGLPAIHAASDDTASLTISNAANPAASASIQFHREGSHAAYFGLDVDNRWKVGGRSMGQISYELWTEQNGPRRVQEHVTSFGADTVGQVCMMVNKSGTVLTPNMNVAGSQIRFSGTTQGGDQPASGTWRVLGRAIGNEATTMMRIN